MMPVRQLLTMALCLSVAGACLPVEAAKKKAKSAKPEAEQAVRSDKPASRKAALEMKPALSPETQQAIDEAAGKLDADTRNTLNKLADAVRLEDRAVFNELRDAEENAVADIGMLWGAAVERNGTIRYAIEKLSRQDATGKPVEGDTFSKRMVQSLVHLGGVAGTMWAQNPAGMIGSNMVQDLMQGNPQDSALTRVTDADMVILAKEVENLQSQLIELYYGYRHAQERLKLAEEASSTIARYYDHAAAPESNTPENLQPLMNSMYESSRQDVQNAQQGLVSARTALTLMVGPDAIAALDEGQTGQNTSSASE